MYVKFLHVARQATVDNMPLDGQDDLSDRLVQRSSYGIDSAVELGLPPLHDEDAPTCGSNHVTSKTCSKNGMLS